MKINANLWQAYSNVKFDSNIKSFFENAIITAWNPESDKLSEYENCVNNQRLQNELIGYDCVLSALVIQSFIGLKKVLP